MKLELPVMTRPMNIIATTFSAILAVSSLGSPAYAADMFGTYTKNDEICAYPAVRSTISDRFRHQVTHVPNLPNVSITSFYDVRLNRYEPKSADHPIERRYCAGNVTLSNGDARNVWYVIEYGQGFASIGDNVEFCVSGFDRWNVYNGRCNTLK